MFQRQKGKLHQNQRRRPSLQRRGRRPTANIRNKLLRADHFTSYVGADMHQSANLAVQHEPKPERALGAKPARPLLTHRSMRRLSRAAHGVIPFTQKTGRRGGAASQGQGQGMGITGVASVFLLRDVPLRPSPSPWAERARPHSRPRKRCVNHDKGAKLTLPCSWPRAFFFCLYGRQKTLLRPLCNYGKEITLHAGCGWCGVILTR